ncbi:hypothetical protein [Absidia glauca]|uniref:Uncharacterized protein n=1 Tax=Absidia glauca TaxID=4829 RepID=A0A168KW35_ABSGL|nr:hypothetical protein [Absidia glauca]
MKANPSSNSTWNKMQYISMEGFQKMMDVYVECGCERYTKTQKSDCSEMPRDRDPSNKTQHPWYHPVHKKHLFLHANFEIRSVSFFTRKFMSGKKGHFSWGMLQTEPSGQNQPAYPEFC